MGLPKGKLVFQPSIFRGELLVLGRGSFFLVKRPKFLHAWKIQGMFIPSKIKWDLTNGPQVYKLLEELDPQV